MWGAGSCGMMWGDVLGHREVWGDVGCKGVGGDVGRADLWGEDLWGEEICGVKIYGVGIYGVKMCGAHRSMG